MTNLATQYNPAYAGRIRVPVATVPPLPLDERKIIARGSTDEGFSRDDGTPALAPLT